MAKSNSKYVTQSENGCPHVGQIVSNQLKAKRKTKIEVARRMGIKALGVKRYTTQFSTQVAILWGLSEAIGVDFFALLSQELQNKYPNLAGSVPNPAQTAMEQRLAELELKVKWYEELMSKRMG